MAMCMCVDIYIYSHTFTCGGAGHYYVPVTGKVYLGFFGVQYYLQYSYSGLYIRPPPLFQPDLNIIKQDNALSLFTSRLARLTGLFF